MCTGDNKQHFNKRWPYCMLKFEKTSRFWHFLVFVFQFFGLKIRVFDEVYHYLVVYDYLNILFCCRACIKKCNWIPFVCQKLLCVKFWKELQILTFLRIFSIFELKIRVFYEVYAYLILQFASVVPAQSLCKKLYDIYLLKTTTLWN